MQSVEICTQCITACLDYENLFSFLPLKYGMLLCAYN